MDPTRNIKLRWRYGPFGNVTYQVARLQFSQLAPQKWQPAINAFRCEAAVRISSSARRRRTSSSAWYRLWIG